MKSTIDADFRRAYAKLPAEIRQLARQKYKLFVRDPNHGSLHFKQIRGQLYSVRINLKYRALGFLEDDEITWFWIGHHTEYDKLLATL